MLIQRLLAAIVLIPLVIICLFFLPLPGFIAVMIAISGLATWEWSQFLHLHSRQHKSVFTLIFTLFIIAIYYVSTQQIGVVKVVLLLSLAWWLLALLLVVSYPNSVRFWRHNVVKTLFACVTLLPFVLGMIALRQVNYSDNSFQGAFWLLYVLVLVWATDSGAYFAGRALGKHKLAPRVSPGKTIEGLIGGVIAALLISLLVYVSGYFFISFDTLMLSSICAILVSVLGDLTESMFKREANIKDSGHLIPGHGGILDRIDSLTAAIPVFAALILYVL
ncbi:phosphatidate cytidylyltransferase [Orbus hercynius]|uniref:Phosphatidate cytidylyltransferase n=1 Tax=Orbus hercynius TaxID=593135 RepID=A0A495RBW2_9GAMM|nr:phosphatidate cytidylyltransferase [Orbus hercynius]RKS84750.1 phosphatidate cytidylyltransferase [Orbus hercynius]